VSYLKSLCCQKNGVWSFEQNIKLSNNKNNVEIFSYSDAFRCSYLKCPQKISHVMRKHVVIGQLPHVKVVNTSASASAFRRAPNCNSYLSRPSVSEKRPVFPLCFTTEGNTRLFSETEVT